MINDVRLALTRSTITLHKHTLRCTGVLRTTMCDVGLAISTVDWRGEIGVDAIGAFGAGFISAAKLIKVLHPQLRLLTFFWLILLSTKSRLTAEITCASQNA